MDSKICSTTACLVTVVTLWTNAAASIPNGDMEDPAELNYWAPYELALPGYAAVNETPDPPGDDVLHVMARNTCTWSASGGWSLDQLSSSAMAMNPDDVTYPDLEVFAPVGTTGLRFDARSEIQTLEDTNIPASHLDVTVHYNEELTTVSETFYLSSGWNGRTIDLSDIDTSWPITLVVTASSGVNFDNFPEGPYDGYVYEVVAEGWFDDFAFIPEPPLPGDADLNGYVDDDDLSLLLANWKQGTEWEHGDFNGDGKVDDDDLSLLLSHWGEGTSPMGGRTVPEPAGLSLLAIGAAGLLRRRGR